MKEGVRRMPFVDAWSHAEIDRVVSAGGPRAKDEKDSAIHAVTLEVSIARVIESSAKEIQTELTRLEHTFRHSKTVTSSQEPANSRT